MEVILFRSYACCIIGLCSVGRRGYSALRYIADTIVILSATSSTKYTGDVECEWKKNDK